MSQIRGSSLRRPALLAGLAAGMLAAGLLAPLPASATPIDAPGVFSTPAAAPGDARIKLQLYAGGLSKPVFVTSARDGTGRLFIVEQTGLIRIYKDGKILATPFKSMKGSITAGYEQGLLGLAFHPGFTTNRKLYINYTNLSGDTKIREYKVSSTNPNVVDSSTGRTILTIPQPYANHNGGSLAFGKDGYLYIGTGDGGSGGDPGERAQNVDSLLGKMLRIDVNGTTSTTQYRNPASNPYVGIAGRNEIWQIGLRNPWHFSFDRQTGDLWIGDVGERLYEEINRAKLTSGGPGRRINWGWDPMEGFHCFEPSTNCSTSGKTRPVLEYGHGSGRCSVTGGYVYRGTAIPTLVGGYVFADYCSGEIWVVTASAASPATKTLLLDTSYRISGFGEGATGELYVLNHAGAMYKIVQA